LKVVEKFTENIIFLPIFNSIRIYGKEKARLKTKGMVISDFDLLICSTAVYFDMILVTRNIKEFERLSNIRIENWIDNQNISQK